MKRINRLVSLLLAAGMIISAVPVSAFAAVAEAHFPDAAAVQDEAENTAGTGLGPDGDLWINKDGFPYDNSMGGESESLEDFASGVSWTASGLTGDYPMLELRSREGEYDFSASTPLNEKIAVSLGDGVTISGGTFFTEIHGVGSESAIIKGGTFHKTIYSEGSSVLIYGGTFYDKLNDEYAPFPTRIYAGVFKQDPRAFSAADEEMGGITIHGSCYALCAENCTINDIPDIAYIAATKDYRPLITLELPADTDELKVNTDSETQSLADWGASEVEYTGNVISFRAPGSAQDVTLTAIPAVVKRTIALPTGATNVTKTVQGSATAEKLTLDSNNSAEVEVGATLAFTVSPDDDMNYTLETDATPVPGLKDNGDGFYSFTVPDADVTIKATPKEHTVTLPKEVMDITATSGTLDNTDNPTISTVKGSKISFKQPVDADVTYWYADGTELKPDENGVYTITVGTEDITIHTERNKHTVILPIHTCDLDTDNGFVLPQGTAVFEDGSWIGDSYEVPGGTTIRFEKTEGANVTFWIVGRDAKTELKPDENGVYHLTVYTSDIKVVEEEIKEPDQPAKPDDKPTTPDDSSDKSTTPDEKPATPDQPATPDEPEEPEIKKSGIILPEPNEYALAAVNAAGEKITEAEKGARVYLRYELAALPEDRMFEGWKVTVADGTAVKVETDENGRTFFTMPDADVAIELVTRAVRYDPAEEEPKNDPEKPGRDDTDAPAASEKITTGTVLVGTAAGAAVGVTGYLLGTRLYLKAVLPEGTAIPTSRGALAMILWYAAGKPEPASAAAFADADTVEPDILQAAHWCAEQGLLSAKDGSFDPDGHVTRVQVIRSWNALQKMMHA